MNELLGGQPANDEKHPERSSRPSYEGKQADRKLAHEAIQQAKKQAPDKTTRDKKNNRPVPSDLNEVIDEQAKADKRPNDGGGVQRQQEELGITTEARGVPLVSIEKAKE